MSSERINAIKDNPGVIFTALAKRGFWNWMPDSLYLKILYKVAMSDRLNLKNPIKYNQKLQWLKIHDRKPEYNVFVDKYAVREYVASKIGDEYLNTCLGVWNNVEDIPFDTLPNQFVLKCTHDSGSVIICKDKSQFDVEKAKVKLRKAFKRNYYYTYREWVYKDVTPRIIAEEYIQNLALGDLPDYKVLCFNGEPEIIEVHQNRFNGKKHAQDYYSTDWEKLPIVQPGWDSSPVELEKPVFLEKMIKFSRTLSQNLYHVRIDWYEAGGKLYFGEITFYDGSGLAPFTPEDEIMLGNKIHLPYEDR